MNILNSIKESFQYVLNGVARIFSPNDDDYPEIGVQPFEGEVNKA